MIDVAKLTPGTKRVHIVAGMTEKMYPMAKISPVERIKALTLVSRSLEDSEVQDLFLAFMRGDMEFLHKMHKVITDRILQL